MQFFRWKVQRKFTLDFMRKFGMSKFNPSTTNKIETKIKTCIDEFFLGKFLFKADFNFLADSADLKFLTDSADLN